jgi:fucose permease
MFIPPNGAKIVFGDFFPLTISIRSQLNEESFKHVAWIFRTGCAVGYLFGPIALSNFACSAILRGCITEATLFATILVLGAFRAIDPAIRNIPDGSFSHTFREKAIWWI